VIAERMFPNPHAPASEVVIVVGRDAWPAMAASERLAELALQTVWAPELGALLALLGQFLPLLVVAAAANLAAMRMWRSVAVRWKLPNLLMDARTTGVDRFQELGDRRDRRIEMAALAIGAAMSASVEADQRGAERMHREPITIDRDRLRVVVDGKPVVVTRSEFRLLEAFVNAPGRVFSRTQLIDVLYPEGAAVIDRVVDVHIGKLRQKIERDPASPRRILTIRGVGYRLADDDDPFDLPAMGMHVAHPRFDLS
jgi:DNA-binding response OmpR family regulator